MDWQVEKKKRGQRGISDLLFVAKMIFQLLQESIYQTNPNILHHLLRYVLQIQITSFVFLWLNKSIESSFVSKEMCVNIQSTYTKLSHQRSGMYQITFNTGRKKNSVKMNTAMYYSLKTIQVHIVTTVCNSNSSGSASTLILQRIWYAVAHDSYLSPWYGLHYKCFPNTGNISCIKQILESDYSFTHNHLAWHSYYTVMSYSIMQPHTMEKSQLNKRV